MIHNIQEDNVGNLGDIVKHGALVALAALLREHNIGAKVNYLDTHAFKLRACMPDAERWRKEVGELRGIYQLYKEYADIEEPVVAEGKYLCSTGLIACALPDCSMFLAERDERTRQELLAHLKDLEIIPAVLACEMNELTFSDLDIHAGTLLALVDPFYETEEVWRDTWRSASASIRALHSNGDDGIVLVFQYQKLVSPVWLAAPEGFGGPVAVADYKPYYLAAYGTKSLEKEMGLTLSRMGWKITN